MALEHLSAPFKNKTHLFTLILLAIAFLTWRMSGGGISMIDEVENDQPSLEPIDNLDQLEAAAERKRRDVRDQLRNKVLGNLVTPKPSEKPERTLPGDSLSDIEKLIGLK